MTTFVPLSEQPPEGFEHRGEFCAVTHRHVFMRQPTDDPLNDEWFTGPAPHVVGDVVNGRRITAISLVQQDGVWQWKVESELVKGEG